MNIFYYSIIVLAAWVLSGQLIGLDSAHADSGDKIETSYEVRVKGVTVLDIKYSSEISGTEYRTEASIETRGVATLFSEYRIEMATLGALVDRQSSPVLYRSRTEKKDMHKAVELNWSEGALWAQARRVGKNAEIQAEIIAALTPNVTDPLTAIFRIRTLSEGNPCEAVYRIFDGKEVFELRFSFKREAVLDDSFRGVYRGKAYECRAIYVPVAGRYATKFRKRNEEPPIYNVWLASIGSDISGESRLVPVRATGRLDGMKFEAYASRVKIDGRQFSNISPAGN